MEINGIIPFLRGNYLEKEGVSKLEGFNWDCKMLCTYFCPGKACKLMPIEGLWT
jgi:hypothetical protein